MNIKYLPTDSEVYDLLSKDITLSNDKLEKTVEAYKQKIKYLEDFQNGADIWSYNYKKYL